MSQIVEIVDRPTKRLIDVTETAVERNNQTRQFITFLHRLFYKIYIKTSQIMNKKDVKIK